MDVRKILLKQLKPIKDIYGVLEAGGSSPPTQTKPYSHAGLKSYPQAKKYGVLT